MKKTYKLTGILIAALLFIQLHAIAQVSVSMQILPPYPTKFTDYSTHPQLMLLTIINTSTTQQRIQLRGTLTGDNGIRISAKQSFKSRNPIVLAAGESRSMNGNDIATFFDYTKLDYSGITQTDFISKNGLPEGAYRVCIRAYNYDTNQPLSTDEPVGCSNTFTIASLEPPVILNPMDGQELSSDNGQIAIFRWNTPVGTPPTIRYRLRIVEVLGNRNPNDAIMSAQKPYFFEKEVMTNTYVYNPADPQLTPGRRYAMLVEAFDPLGQTPFRNNGRSEVVSFTYGQPAVATVTNTTKAEVFAGPDCSCKGTIPAGSVKNDLVNIGTEIKMNAFTMKVLTVNKQEDGLAGTGTVAMPFIGSALGAKLRVNFSGVQVNSQLQMMAGNVDGVISGNAASLLPTFDPPNTKTIALTPSAVDNIGAYFNSNKDHLMSQVKNSAASTGFELPLGLDKGPVTVGIMKVHFTAVQAWFDAVTAMDLPDGNTKVSLSGKGICMNPASLCGDALLYLNEDFAIPVVGLALKAQQDNGVNKGTSIVFDKDGFKNLHITAEYTFPAGSLVKVDGGEAAKAYIDTDTDKGWGDWIAEVSVDPFKIGKLSDFSFALAAGKKILYDHSDTRNPANLPQNITNSDGSDRIATNLPTWRGFYIPQVDIKLPSLLQTIDDKGITVSANDLIFDGGISGSVNVNNVLTLKTGSLGGWFFSIDNINLKFWKSSFESSGMAGRLVLPPSGKDADNQINQLNYTCNLTKPENSDLTFQFKVTPKDDLEFSALWAKLKIDGSSSIVIGNEGGKMNATATLNGQLTLRTDIKDMPDVTLAYLTFNNLRLSTDGTSPIGDDTKINTGTGEPPANNTGWLHRNGMYDNLKAANLHGPNPNFDGDAELPAESSQGYKLFGFNISVTDVDMILTGSKAGFKFTTNLSLADLSFVPKASARFAVYANISPTDAGNRKFWGGIGGEVESIKLSANSDLGPMKIGGEIAYYNIPEQFDRGFSGKLDVKLPGVGLGFAMKGQFGSKKPNATGASFTYFYIDALLDLGQTGITMFPGTALYGFAGGAAYNMHVLEQDTIKASAATGKQMPDDKNDPRYINATTSFSGRTYVPDNQATGNISLLAGVFFGLTNRSTFDSDITLNLKINGNGGVDYFGLDGRGRLLCDPTLELNVRQEKAIGKGTLNIGYDFQNKVFFLNSQYALNFAGILKSTGSIEFKIDGEHDGLWYLRMGRPWGVGQPWETDIMGVLSMKSYFECGNNVAEIDNMPGVPQWVTDIKNGVSPSNNENSGITSVQPGDAKNNRNMDEAHSGKGMIMGFTNKFSVHPEFLMFFGDLTAGFGADLSLKNYGDGTNCGVGGWYATGQAYIAADARVGIKVNVFGFKKKITFVHAGAYAIVQAGAPAPIWVRGVIGGNFSVLDGLIHGGFNLKFHVGEVCDPGSLGNEAIKIIADISPADKLTDVGIVEQPAVSFNFPVNRVFTVPLINDKGETELTDYLIDDVAISLTNSKTGHTMDKSAFDLVNEKVYSYKSKNDLLETEGDYIFKVVVSPKVRNSAGGWPPALDDHGKAYKDDTTVVFHTNKGMKNLDLSLVQEMLPYHRLRNMPYNALSDVDESRSTGYIKMRTAVGISQFDVGQTVTDFRVKLIPDNQSLPVVEQPIDGIGTAKWTFPVTGLRPGANYFVQVVAHNNTSPTPSGGNKPATVASMSKLISYKTTGVNTSIEGLKTYNASYDVSKQDLIQDRLATRTNEKPVMVWYFNTGVAATYKDKLDNLTIKELIIGDKKVSAANSQAVNRALLGVSQTATSADLNPGSYSLMYTGPERFNYGDLQPVKRNDLLPSVSNYDKISWQSMFTRAKVDPVEVASNTTTDWSTFIQRTLGLTALDVSNEILDKMLNWKSISPNLVSENIVINITYPGQTDLLPSRLDGVAIEDLQQSANTGSGTGTITTSPSTNGGSNASSSTTGGTVKPVYTAQTVISAAGLGKTLYNTVQQDVLLYDRSYATSQGIPVMTVENQIMKVIKLKTQWLVDPAPDGFTTIGNVMDKTRTAMQLATPPVIPNVGAKGAAMLR